MDAALNRAIDRAIRQATDDLWASLFPPITGIPSDPLADIERLIDQLTPRFRIEKWCVLDMVPDRWEPLTGWLPDKAIETRVATLRPGLYRLVDHHTRQAIDFAADGQGHMIRRTDGRAWLEPWPILERPFVEPDRVVPYYRSWP